MNKLILGVKVALSDIQKERLDQIDKTDFSNVEKLVKKDLEAIGFSPSPAYLANGIFALKQYYAVALLDPLNEQAVSKDLDPFWHSHILFTKEYVEFCDNVFRGYVHHTPLDNNDKSAVSKVFDLYQYTSDVYKKLFTAESIDLSWWPQASDDVLVCLHQLAHDPALVASAIFPRRDQISA